MGGHELGCCDAGGYHRTGVRFTDLLEGHSAAGHWRAGGKSEIASLKDEFYWNESPQRRVKIAQPFAVGKFEVTFAEWDACVAERGCTQTPFAGINPSCGFFNMTSRPPPRGRSDDPELVVDARPGADAGDGAMRVREVWQVEVRDPSDDRVHA
jgi:formylglycine-generating enzyme required for sulfatase activity